MSTLAPIACQTCVYWHNPGDPCLFDECSTCGGEFPFGPSTSALCGICAEGERLVAVRDSERLVPVPDVDHDEPF